ncbi:glutamyl-tRNA reductase [Arthrobacter sp. JZ12]|uniref:glutamyl-tRNA reductase n=1 Tax=Arthrobacter sp. JZ12 TaxID=2654190 RepID=UPI002B4A8894|nr:glutamyl-tRNA reductase [Arthrobacter sp. JZ12]WRH25456.1 glutamyl-tRNA reductase [Arthrobacter sp. JZ12]
MNYFSLVATHSDIDLETVARLSVGASQVASSALQDSPALTGAVTLATCNRFEIYGEAASEQDVEAARASLITAISEQSGLPKSTVSDSFATLTGQEVPRHLFSVSSGLDSAVVGEREIAGQVRRALIESQGTGTASGGLVRLFQAASRTARDVGAQTALGARGRSIVSVALDLASDLAGNPELSDKAVVIFGTGAYAGATMALLRERGCTDISVYSPSGRAESFVATRGGAALSEETLPAALTRADVVIGCSGSERRVSADDVRRLREGVDRTLVIVDLALSHDFDPEVDMVENVELITLESVRLAAPEEQAESLRQAGDLVSKAAESFQEQVNARSVDASIVALRKHTHQVLEAEMARVRAQHGCTAAAEEVEFALRRMVRQLLHIPTVRARQLAAEGRQEDYTAALEALYGIEPEQAVAPAATSEQACPAHQAQVDSA